jgi:Icc-related predicted phosphoesterase
MASFDYCSDLHIDYWDKKWRTLYMREGEKHHPMCWKKKSDLLVVAGDISDNLDYSIEYLKEIKKYYKKIIFVDGNHEHIYITPKIYTKKCISDKFLGLDGIHYLPSKDIIVEKTVFIGACAWWDYDKGNKFDKDKMELSKNIFKVAKKEAMELEKKITKYEKNNNIEDIVIVTHTVPLKKFARNSKTDYSCFLRNLNLGERTKVKRWVFGHSHEKNECVKYGIKMFSNPRGRPADFDRVKYSVKTSTI